MYHIVTATKNGRVSKHYASQDEKYIVFDRLVRNGFIVQSIETRRGKGLSKSEGMNRLIRDILGV